MSQNAVEALFAERWGDVVDLVEAFRAFEERALDQFESKAGPIVQAWLAERGFELEIDPKYADFRAYRQKWLDSDGNPSVQLVVGGLLPKGIAKVECDAPYLWVYVKLAQPERSRVAEALAQSAGQPWLDREVRERQPLGRYIRYEAVDRLQLARDPQRAAEFAIAKFPDVLALEPLITQVLPALA
jgi:hypothetical protein